MRHEDPDIHMETHPYDFDSAVMRHGQGTSTVALPHAIYKCQKCFCEVNKKSNIDYCTFDIAINWLFIFNVAFLENID